MIPGPPAGSQSGEMVPVRPPDTEEVPLGGHQPDGDADGGPIFSKYVQSIEVVVSAYVSPDDLKKYADINPELAALVLRHNLQSNDAAALHVREMDKAEQSALIADRKVEREIEARGQYFGLYVALGGFLLCAYGFSCGFATQAAALGTVMIVALVGSFISGRVLNRNVQDNSAGPGPDTAEA